jgi:sugar/nucleoside kinase (ribokinase family)
MIALLGNLARDVFPGAPPRTGGAPYHAARALNYLQCTASIYARCAPEDRGALMAPLIALGHDVHYVPGDATASFGIAEDGERRTMQVLAIGDTWLSSDLPSLPVDADWVHVAPLLRSDFPAETLATLAQGRRLSLDGQGLVRPGRLGPLELDGRYDPDLLRDVDVLKLSDEEAEVLGDVAGLPVGELLVTHGPHGATVYIDGRPEEIGASAIGGNHTGTGDAFAISYLAARSAGFDPADAARSATAVVAALLSERS